VSGNLTELNTLFRPRRVLGHWQAEPGRNIARCWKGTIVAEFNSKLTGVKIHNETRKGTSTQKPVEREKCTSFLPAIVQGPIIYCTRTRTSDLLWLVDVWSCRNSRNCQHCAPGAFLKFAPSVRIIFLAAALPFPDYLSDNISNLDIQVSHGPTSPLHTLSQNQLENRILETLPNFVHISKSIWF
jgi:hypothetical protein